jgi:hypothetical protein
MIAQLLNTLIGVWLMAAPGVLSYDGPGRTNDHIVGPIIATFACAAVWEATRSARWVNLPLGVWLLAAPWALGYTGAPMWNGLLCGVAVAILSCVRGRMKHRFDGGWRAVFWRSAN